MSVSIAFVFKSKILTHSSSANSMYAKTNIATSFISDTSMISVVDTS